MLRGILAAKRVQCRLSPSRLSRSGHSRRATRVPRRLFNFSKERSVSPQVESRSLSVYRQQDEGEFGLRNSPSQTPAYSANFAGADS